MVPPVVEGFFGIFIIGILHDSPEDITEVGVAGVLDSFYEIEWCPVGMATHVDSPVVISIITVVGGAGTDDTFLQSDQCVDRFKGRTRRVLGHQCPVEEWIQRIGREGADAFAQVPADEHIGIHRG